MRPEPIPPGPNQESVWDYPRPPRVEAVTKRIRIIFNQQLIVDTRRSKRILETSHPPNYYIPLDDIKTEYLKPSDRTSYCEWKGQAHYYSLQVGDRQAKDVAWYYPQISPSYVALTEHVGFYPGPMDTCYVDDEKVEPQAGSFYAGWITQDIVGPFKGGPGSWGW
ncbi:MAG: DUF427 domain-containing protein [Phormidesmis sp.]